jgi:ADP-ribosylglycohydrolase
MLGAIIGDIVGSIYEWNNIKTKEFPLFSSICYFTDDSVMTLAIAEALMNGGEERAYIEAMLRLGRMYPNSGYGGGFRNWLFSEKQEPYNSWGNGSAMRVSPVGWWCDTLRETEKFAERSAAVTHNHPEGIKGACATAGAIFLLRNGATKSEIKDYVEREYKYDLSRTLDQIRPVYRFNESCQETVPEAIIAFLESVDFEDAIRNAISLGGDSDTLTAITGSLAEAAYAVPEQIKIIALSFLDKPLLDIYKRWEATIIEKGKKMFTNKPKFTPYNINKLEDYEIFVFGSNLAGMHAGGAARVAQEKFGAILGQGVGLQGQCYAIPTMQGGVETIKPYVDEFILFAREHPQKLFYVTRIGCGIAGFRDEDIAPLFRDAVCLDNVCLPESFYKCIVNKANE